MGFDEMIVRYCSDSECFDARLRGTSADAARRAVLRLLLHRPMLRGVWADSPWSVGRFSVKCEPILKSLRSLKSLKTLKTLVQRQTVVGSDASSRPVLYSEALNLVNDFVRAVLHVLLQFLEEELLASRFHMREAAYPVALHLEDAQHHVFHVTAIVLFAVPRCCDALSQQFAAEVVDVFFQVLAFHD